MRNAALNNSTKHYVQWKSIRHSPLQLVRSICILHYSTLLYSSALFLGLLVASEFAAATSRHTLAPAVFYRKYGYLW